MTAKLDFTESKPTKKSQTNQIQTASLVIARFARTLLFSEPHFDYPPKGGSSV
jgi:hypothetical protein